MCNRECKLETASDTDQGLRVGMVIANLSWTFGEHETETAREKMPASDRLRLSN
jgi:hypothetical protein